MNRLETVFSSGKKGILNMYCTAGYPYLQSTTEVLLALQESGADIIELGMPYSDPIADGPVIQKSNMQALENGITLPVILQQLQSIKSLLRVPIVLMGYLNPVLQYGFEKFCKDASEAGATALILPDMPIDAYQRTYMKILEKHQLDFIFLVTPQTTDKRIKLLDELSTGFLYAVSSSATTGSSTNEETQLPYFKKLKKLKLNNPVLIGFGIKDKSSFDMACQYANGAIIGSAYIKALSVGENISSVTNAFIKNIRSGS